MSSMKFVKAERKKAKARILLAGPSGSGKTWSALLIAKGIGGKIAAIDTEAGSLSNYEHLAAVDVLELGPPFSPEHYMEAIDAAANAGYDVLIIDSITHEWNGKGGILEIKDKLTGANDYTKWGQLTPRHSAFIEAMLHAPLHVIATVRSKTEYVLEENDKGKQAPRKVGMAPVQRDGMEYEFTTVFDLRQQDNVASCSKDRTGLFRGDPGVITEAVGTKIAEWLEGGVDTETGEVKQSGPAPAPPPVDEKAALIAKINARAHEIGKEAYRPIAGNAKLSELTAAELRGLLDALNAWTPEPEPAAAEAPEPAAPDADDNPDPFGGEYLDGPIPEDRAAREDMANKALLAIGRGKGPERASWFSERKLPLPPNIDKLKDADLLRLINSARFELREREKGQAA